MSKRTGSSATDGADTEFDATIAQDALGVAEEGTSANNAIPEAKEEVAPKKGAKGTKAAKARRYGLERFLQLYPQPPYVETLLRAFCANEVLTVEEWYARINELLNHPIQYKKD